MTSERFDKKGDATTEAQLDDFIDRMSSETKPWPTRDEVLTFLRSLRTRSAGEGWRLIKDSTFEQRSWKEDESHENGNYHCICHDCGRTFQGHKRRPLCKVCTDNPSLAQSARGRSKAETSTLTQAAAYLEVAAETGITSRLNGIATPNSVNCQRIADEIKEMIGGATDRKSDHG